jgi:HPt (histidine-containing phosphotransfer) domain-containing protein
MRLGLELIQEVNQQIEDRIRTQNPTFSEGEIRAEFVRQMYKDELSEEYLEGVTQWILEKYSQRSNS